MAPTIETGMLLVKKDVTLPGSMTLEGDLYVKNWTLVKNLSSSEMDRKLSAVGWNFFYMAGELKATAFGSDSEKTIHTAVKRLIAQMKSDKFNCLEISRVTGKSFLGLPYVTVAGHPRHIQESLYLFHTKPISEWDQQKLPALGTEVQIAPAR